MFIDLSVSVSASSRKNAFDNETMVSFGHLGTHFDVMNKEFPLEYIELSGLVFDVSGISGRDIGKDDVNLSLVETGMFVAFYSGYIEKVQYGTEQYFTEHPQLSESLIEDLLDKNISIIGIDFAGIRRGKEHTPKDQYCADRGVFIVENLCNLKRLLGVEKKRRFTAHTYPVKFTDMSGLPCRVVGEI